MVLKLRELWQLLSIPAAFCSSLPLKKGPFTLCVCAVSRHSRSLFGLSEEGLIGSLDPGGKKRRCRAGGSSPCLQAWGPRFL